jgi:PAS domain S-box-containing protein
MSKIMVVDDEAIITTQLQERLTLMGYEVVGKTSSGEKSINMAKRLKPDLILMDIVMPGKMDGIDASEIIRTRFDIPVIFLTAYADDELIKRAKDTGPYGYILKPFQEKELKAAIEVALNRKDWERLLSEYEERYRSVVDYAGDAIISVDDQANIVSWNRTAEKMFDYLAREIIGKPATLIVPERFHGNLLSIVSRAFSNRESVAGGQPVESYGLRKDGSEFPLELSFASWKTQQGVFFTGVIRDLTERKKVEESLRESEKKYRNLFNNAQVGLFRSRIADGKILECNDLLAKMFGYRNREECIARHITAEHYVDPNIREQGLAQMLAKGKVENLEALVTRQDGFPFWISYSATIYLERDCIEGIVIDITERKKVEEMLRVAEERFFKAFRASPDAISISRMADGTLLEVNDMWEKILGYSRAESVGKNTVALGVWSDPSIRQKCVKQLQKTGSLRNFETDLRRKTGELCQVSLSSERIEIEGEQCLLTIIRDITERKKVRRRCETKGITCLIP